MPTATANERHYGLDWLRIAAFALLILYHVAMVFAPWAWLVKSPHTYPALIAPMALLTPWRLALLFAVSGYASRKLFERSGSVGRFARSRSHRLLVPLAFGMVAIVPPQVWVRVRDHGYPHGLAHFWAFDSLRIGEFFSVDLPSWEHLWFVVYLWAYTMLLAAALAIADSGAVAYLDRRSLWLTHGSRMLWAPIAGLVTVKLALLFVVPERQGLFNDWSGHAEFLPLFLFGFVLGGSRQLWGAIERLWKPSLLVALVSGAVAAGTEVVYPGLELPPHWLMALERAARLAMAWSVVLLLFQFADRFWNRDHRWRATLGEAVFPFYLVHQTVIVLAARWLLRFALPPLLTFVLLAAITLGGCLLFYLLGRSIGWLCPLIGLRARPAAAREQSANRALV